MTKFYLLAAAAATLAAPAFASPKLADPVASGMPAASDAVLAGTAHTASPTQKYCVVDTSTASIIARKTCRTRDQWLKNGFDPLAAK